MPILALAEMHTKGIHMTNRNIDLSRSIFHTESVRKSSPIKEKIVSVSEIKDAVKHKLFNLNDKEFCQLASLILDLEISPLPSKGGMKAIVRQRDHKDYEKFLSSFNKQERKKMGLKHLEEIKNNLFKNK